MSDQPGTRRGAARTAPVWPALVALVASVAERTDAPTEPDASIDAGVRSGQGAESGVLQILDLGGGTGGVAVPLAALGHEVTVVDPSADALAALTRRAADLPQGRVTGIQGDADSIGAIFPEPAFDVVCCHGTLEVVDDPAATLAAIHKVLRPGGSLSLVAAGRLAHVLAKAAAGDLVAAHRALVSADGRHGDTDALPRRFDRAQLAALLEEADFTLDSFAGLGMVTPLVPAARIDSDADRAALADLERALSEDAAHPHWHDFGAALHLIAHRS